MPRTPTSRGSFYYQVIYYDEKNEIVGQRTEEFETLGHAKSQVTLDLKKHKKWKAEIYKTDCQSSERPVLVAQTNKKGVYFF